MNRTGRFITLEGGEGTGKSTLIQGLSAALAAREIDVVVTREPGGTTLAEEVRSLALNPPGGETWSPLAHALLMNTAREDHLKNKIRPALMRGAWVVCDRFADSTLAYQSIDGVSLEALMTIQDIVVGESQPDLTLVLDAPPEVLFERRRQRETSDVFEAKDLEFHKRVRAAFLSIAERAPSRCVILDALQAPEDVLEAALAVIEARLIAL